MFGNSPDCPQDEDSRFVPASPYACAKVYAHHMVNNYREAYGLFAVSGILFNHESPRRGPEFLTRKVAMAAARIKRGEQAYLQLGDLTPRRDWGFAGDYTQAMQAMLRTEQPQDFVVATGQDHSVQDWVQASFEAVDLDWRDYVRQDPALLRKSEVRRLKGRATRAREVLGWQPQVDFQGLVEKIGRAHV